MEALLQTKEGRNDYDDLKTKTFFQTFEIVRPHGSVTSVGSCDAERAIRHT